MEKVVPLLAQINILLKSNLNQFVSKNSNVSLERQVCDYASSLAAQFQLQPKKALLGLITEYQPMSDTELRLKTKTNSRIRI